MSLNIIQIITSKIYKKYTRICTTKYKCKIDNSYAKQ